MAEGASTQRHADRWAANTDTFFVSSPLQTRQAIALGHPLAASGARITANAVHNLIRLDKKHAVVSACIGGGQGIALVLERV